ncbi:MAG: murein transglycosylase A [Alphaproteobacteria bacterium]
MTLLTACALVAPPAEPLRLSPAGFDSLRGWEEDTQSAALPAFLLSCRELLAAADDEALGSTGLAGTVGDWRGPCEAAARVEVGDDRAARAFFESWFVPFRIRGARSDTGLFTGYYEPRLLGSRRWSAGFRVPVYRRPDDLVTVDLGLFRKDWEGERLVGRVVDGSLTPYPARADIAAGALAGRSLELVWVDDPVDAFFLHIQGSGRVELVDGGVMRVGYAVTNGRPYVAIGRILVERGAIAPEEVSLDSISAWLEAHADQAGAVMAMNPSYVFFRELSGEAPLGAQGVPLTPGRSLAVDRRFLPLGALLWVDTRAPAAEPGAPDRPLRRLMVAQDTGGAIRGAIRGDVFWGSGWKARAVAGRMRHPGTYYLLLPRSAAPPVVAVD